MAADIQRQIDENEYFEIDETIQNYKKKENSFKIAKTTKQDKMTEFMQKKEELKEAQKKEKAPSSDNAQKNTADSETVPDVNLIRLYEFETLDDVIDASHGLNGYFQGANTLYKDSSDDTYKLVIHQSSCTAEEFNKVCNILTEYGRGRAFTLSGEAYLKEHGEVISQSALQQLTQL